MAMDGTSHRQVRVLAISGMTCGGCKKTAERVLSRVPGVTEATVDLEGGRATVAGDADTAALVAAIEGAGFGAEPVEGATDGRA